MTYIHPPGVCFFHIIHLYQGLTFESDSGEEAALWRLTSLSRLLKAKFKLPCNFEESPYVTRIFLPCVIYENVNIMFTEIYVSMKYFESDFLEK